MSSHFLERLLGMGKHGYGGQGGHHGRGYGQDPFAPRQDPAPSSQAPTRVLVCPKCRADNAADARFCTQCGERFGGAEAACGKCGAKMAANAKFCPDCGEAK
ncbi:MAG: zinc-ribbon domain-containing protein [Pseudomonadota bacterium]